jgi:hypothetical protein
LKLRGSFFNFYKQTQISSRVVSSLDSWVHNFRGVDTANLATTYAVHSCLNWRVQHGVIQTKSPRREDCSNFIRPSWSTPLLPYRAQLPRRSGSAQGLSLRASAPPRLSNHDRNGRLLPPCAAAAPPSASGLCRGRPARADTRSLQKREVQEGPATASPAAEYWPSRGLTIWANKKN